MKIGAVEKYLDSKIPFSTASSWDNVGLLVGSREPEVTGVMLALDVTVGVVEEAVKNGCNLIVSHHPIIFHAIKSVVDSGEEQGVICALLKHGISAICIHTPLDFCENGTNDALAKAAGLQDPEMCCEDKNGLFFGRIGAVKEKTLTDLVTRIKSVLSAPIVLYHERQNSTGRVAVIAGSGGSEILAVKAAGADTLITGEVKHDHYALAENAGINLVVVGHYHSEKPGLEYIEKLLCEEYGEIKICYTKSLDNLYKAL